MSSNVSNLGRALEDMLTTSSQSDRWVEAGRAVGTNLEVSEENLLKSFSEISDPAAIAKLAKDILGEQYSPNQTYKLTYLQTAAQTIYNRAERAYMTFQMVKSKAHDIVMDVIRRIGR